MAVESISRLVKLSWHSRPIVKMAFQCRNGILPLKAVAIVLATLV